MFAFFFPIDLCAFQVFPSFFSVSRQRSSFFKLLAFYYLIFFLLDVFDLLFKIKDVSGTLMFFKCTLAPTSSNTSIALSAISDQSYNGHSVSHKHQ
jgi:hypothetical protein